MNLRLESIDKVSFRHSLRGRLLLWTVLLTGVILSAVVLVNYLNFRNRLEEEAGIRASYLASTAANEIDSKLFSVEVTIEGFARLFETDSVDTSYASWRTLRSKAWGWCCCLSGRHETGHSQALTYSARQMVS